MNIVSLTKLCKFDIIFGVIKEGKLYCLEIPSLDEAMNKVINHRGTVMLKKEVFEHYGVGIVVAKV